MQSSFYSIIIFFLFNLTLNAQSEKSSSSFSLVISNGISNQSVLKKKREDDYKVAYVNAIGLYYSFAPRKNFQSFIGLQYEKNGYTTNWVCESNWDYCYTLGIAPIDVRSVTRLHYGSMVINGKIILQNNFYFRSGVNIDVPFSQTYSSKYTDSYNKVSRDRDKSFYGSRTLFNISLGANLTFGKSFSINEKWGWFSEINFKTYNLLAFRLEDYEYYFLKKNEHPFFLSINFGVNFNK
ncbi:MAG: hypothetical protein AB8F94_00430 [Saprospiraceae bacterium]